MKYKMLKVFLILVFFYIFSFNIKASCNDSELNDWAEKVSIKFVQEEATEDYEPEVAYLLLIDSYNEKVNVKATDIYSDSYYDVEYDEEYKTQVIGSYIHFEEKKYTIKIYGNELSSCKGELLRTIEYSVPSYNLYMLTDFCQQDEYKNEDICRMNTDTSDITEEEFNEEATKIETINNQTTFDKILDIILKYWYYAVIPFVVIACIYIYKVHKYKKEQDSK